MIIRGTLYIGTSMYVISTSTITMYICTCALCFLSYEYEVHVHTQQGKVRRTPHRWMLLADPGLSHRCTKSSGHARRQGGALSSGTVYPGTTSMYSYVLNIMPAREVGLSSRYEVLVIRTCSVTSLWSLGGGERANGGRNRNRAIEHTTEECRRAPEHHLLCI